MGLLPLLIWILIILGTGGVLWLIRGLCVVGSKSEAQHDIQCRMIHREAAILDIRNMMERMALGTVPTSSVEQAFHLARELEGSWDEGNDGAA